MHSNSRKNWVFAAPTPTKTRASANPPRGSIYIGKLGANELWLTPTDRSYMVLLIGAPGTGKTTVMESMARQDIEAGHSTIVLDPMGALYRRLAAFCAYRASIGCPVPGVLFCNPSDGKWVFPFDPFVRREGDISVQVERRAEATLRAWRQHTGDETPRLQKWLQAFYAVLIESGLTILEAAFLLDQHASDVREFLMHGLTNPFIRSKLEQLGRYRPADFAQQTESVENRLMRFLASPTISRMMGTGHNALDIEAIMNQHKVLLVNLQTSAWLSKEKRRLIGGLILNEFYETSLTRPSGAPPCYGYIDEAAEFVSVEIAEAVEQCRQKGFHLTLGFQHPAQFREEGLRVYKAIKNIRNKFVFTLPSREDAQELADDVVTDLVNPEVKIPHRHLNHRLIDVREQATTQSRGTDDSRGRGSDRSRAWTDARGQSQRRGLGKSDSLQDGQREGQSRARGGTVGVRRGRGHSDTDYESHAHGMAEGHQRIQTHTVHSALTTGEVAGISQHDGLTVMPGNNGEGDRVLHTSGQGKTSLTNRNRTSGISDSIGEGDSLTTSEQDVSGRSRTDTETEDRSRGRNWELTRSSDKSSGTTQTDSEETSTDRSRNHSKSGTNAARASQQHTLRRSVAMTDQPGVKHVPLWEPDYWTLEEKRWRASEQLMRQPTGSWFASTPTSSGFGSSPLPPRFYIMPKQLLGLCQQYHERTSFHPTQADAMVEERQARLVSQARAFADQHQPQSAEPTEPLPPSSMWNRAIPANQTPVNGQTDDQSRQRRGPKPDVDNHLKVSGIIVRYGNRWMHEDNLPEICAELDEQRVPVPKQWPTRPKMMARSWRRGLENDRALVVKAIKDRLKAAVRENGHIG